MGRVPGGGAVGPRGPSSSPSSSCLRGFYAGVGLLVAVGLLLLIYSVRLLSQSSGRGWTRDRKGATIPAAEVHPVVWVDQPGTPAKRGGPTDHGHRQPLQPQQQAGAAAQGAPAFAESTAHPLKLSMDPVDMSAVSVVVAVRSGEFPVRLISRLAATRLAKARFIIVAVDALGDGAFEAGIRAASDAGRFAREAARIERLHGRDGKRHPVSGAPAVPGAHGNGGSHTSNKAADARRDADVGGGGRVAAGAGGAAHDVVAYIDSALHDESAFISFAESDPQAFAAALGTAVHVRVSKDEVTGVFPSYAEMVMRGADEAEPSAGLVYVTDGTHVPAAPLHLDRLVAAHLEAVAAAPPGGLVPALTQCTVTTQSERPDQARDGLLVTVDQGFDVHLGSLRSQPAVFFSRRHAGISTRDHRVTRVPFVTDGGAVPNRTIAAAPGGGGGGDAGDDDGTENGDASAAAAEGHVRHQRVIAASPFCTVVDRVALYKAGGFTADGPSGFDLAISGKLNGRVVEESLETLRARIMRVEKTMESISLAEVHSAGNTLRQLVREAYAEVVDASALWEEVTGKTFDSELSRRLLPHAQQADERAMREMAHEPIDVRLRFHTKNLVDDTVTARKVGQSRDAAQVEDQIGWDLSLRLRQGGYSVAAAPVFAILSMEELSEDVRGALSLAQLGQSGPTGGVRPALPAESPSASRRSQNGNAGAQQSASFPLIGNLATKWGSYARALHPALRDPTVPVVRVVWFAICCGCCGFSSEIVHFVHPLQQRYHVNLMPGPKCFCQGYPAETSDSLARMHLTGEQFMLQRTTRDEVLVWISHTDPSSYANDIFSRRRPDYIVGRSMYEFSRIGDNWVDAAVMADEVWVPAKWVRDVFVASGMPASKLVIVPEAVDTDFYAPTAHTALPLPLSGLEKEHWVHYCNRPAAEEEAEPGVAQQRSFKFLSNFKWEPRKGWEELFEAYELQFGSSAAAKAFQRTHNVQPATSSRPVSLYVLSYLFLLGGGNVHNVSRMVSELEGMVTRKFPDLAGDVSRLPHFCIITDTVSEVELAQLYAASDAFVLPTRGEGWGLPAIQAMSMALPTIGTTWGGQDEFMTRDTTFGIELEGLEEVPEDSIYGFQRGKKWAVPSVRHTAELMRYVAHVDPQHAKEVGRRARKHIVANFGEDAVADVVDRQLQRIRGKVLADRRAKKKPAGGGRG